MNNSPIKEQRVRFGGTRLGNVLTRYCLTCFESKMPAPSNDIHCVVQRIEIEIGVAIS